MNKIAIAASLLAGTLAQPAQAQSVRELVEGMLDDQASRMANVENYTVVQEVSGIETTQYFEPREVNGRRVFMATGMWVNGSEIGDVGEEAADPFSAFQSWMESASIEGSENIEGHDTWIISTNDLSAMSGQPLADQGMEEGTVRMFVDKDEHILRRTVFEGIMNDGSGPREVQMTMDMGDYRNVDGVLHPFLVSGSVQGAMDDEEAKQMQEQLKEAEAQLEQLPAALRGQLESQLEQMRSMATGGGMTFQVVTKELTVNQGPPQG